jgi:hypothetical protein
MLSYYSLLCRIDNIYLRESGNITGYEDIPKDQKENLSNETIEALKSLPRRSFVSSNYSELTEEQRRHFKRNLNGEGVTVDSRNATPPPHVFYKGRMYTCDTDRYTEGA